ncbi:hypothetical protein N824_10710 [Pedobacter sp. V48]|nr:hypothetical protein N824_10710 [Pedobacter sp. V48]
MKVNGEQASNGWNIFLLPKSFECRETLILLRVEVLRSKYYFNMRHLKKSGIWKG